MSLNCSPIIWSIDGSACGFAPAGGFTDLWLIDAGQLDSSPTEDSFGKITNLTSHITGSAKQYKPVVTGQLTQLNEGDVAGQTIVQTLVIPMSWNVVTLQQRIKELEKHAYNRTYAFMRKFNTTYMLGHKGNGFLAEAGGINIDTLATDAEIPNVTLTLTARNAGLFQIVDETAWTNFIESASTSSI